MDNKVSLVLNLQNRIIVLEKARKSDSEFVKYTTYTAKETERRLNGLELSKDSFSKSDYISFVAMLIALISAICTGLYFIYGVFKKKQVKKREFFNGAWGSEGDIINPQPLPYLSFVIETNLDDGKITGTYYPNNKSYPVALSINGQLKCGKAKIKITHISQQKEFVYGKVELEIREKIMNWKTISGEKELFPKLSNAWKVNHDPSFFTF